MNGQPVSVTAADGARRAFSSGRAGREHWYRLILPAPRPESAWSWPFALRDPPSHGAVLFDRGRTFAAVGGRSGRSPSHKGRKRWEAFHQGVSMPVAEPNRRLAALLHEATWNASGLARAVRELGAAQGLTLRYDRTAVAHWLGGTLPRHPAPQLVAAALTQRLGRLITAQDAGLTRPRKSPLELSVTPVVEADPVRRLLKLCAGESDPERRAFLAKSAYTVSALAAPAAFQSPSSAATPPPSTSPRPGEVRVGASDAAALQDMTQTFAMLTEQHGGAYVRAMLTAYLNDQVSRVLHATATARLRTKLLVGAAQLTHLLAAANDDSGNPGLAQHYFHTALALSRQAGDLRLHAITLRAMSVQALRLGHRRYAHALAEAAFGTPYGVGDPATTSFLLVQRARTHAVNGERRQQRLI
uniref:Sporulation protein n=1 Tax=Streptomyces sp. WT6 TaxID=1486372 RepID=A0A023PYR3_9ACTN|nr:hypothetical protein wt6.21c [Streptomyces sp. WT6]